MKQNPIANPVTFNMKLPSLISKVPAVLTLALIGFISFASSLGAAVINFDTPGYTVNGNLNGSSQPTGTKWSGGSSDYTIASAIGFDGTNGLRFNTKASGNANSSFTPTTTSTGDLPGFNGSSSILETSFQFRFLESPSSSTSAVAVIQFGYDGTNSASRFAVRADGSLTYSAGTSTSQVATGFKVTNTTAWTTITVRLDYATKKYTFAINGTPFTIIGNPEGLFSFHGNQSVAVLRFQNVGTPDHRQVVLDNITMNVIPEPSSTALVLGSVVVGMVVFRRFGALKRA